MISKSKTSDKKYLTKKLKEKIEDRPDLKKKTKPETFQKEFSPIPLNIDFGRYYALVIGNNNYQWRTWVLKEVIPFLHLLFYCQGRSETVLDGTQLFSNIRRPVMLNSDQTPEYSDIREAGHDGGDFLFVRVR